MLTKNHVGTFVTGTAAHLVSDELFGGEVAGLHRPAAQLGTFQALVVSSNI